MRLDALTYVGDDTGPHLAANVFACRSAIFFYHLSAQREFAHLRIPDSIPSRVDRARGLRLECNNTEITH